MTIFHHLETTPEKEIFPNWFGRMIHGENMTVAYYRAKAGDVVVIPSNVVHYGQALTDVRVIDVFSPVREEYR